jgi:putative hemolysin
LEREKQHDGTILLTFIHPFSRGYKMSNHIALEIIIVISLILLNGLFSMAEMAIVYARKTRLAQQAEDGDPGAKKALDLASDPNRFLSTAQVGITLIGILSGAFGGATLAEALAEEINKIALLAPYSEGISVAVIVIAITYLSLVFGELVPKRLALNNAEQTAASLAPLMHTLSKITTPIVKLLSASTDFVLRVLGAHPSGEPEVTEDDLKSMLNQGRQNGIFEESEQEMVERIFRLSDRVVSTLITPRTEVVFFDIDDSPEEIYQKINANPFSWFPVIQNSPDNIVGIVHLRDLLLQSLKNQPFDIKAVLQQPLFIPATTSALDSLEQLKSPGVEMAIVIDEYGGVLGLLTMNDLLEAIVGEIASSDGEQEAEAIRREDGSWLFDGMILADDLKDILDLDALPLEEEGRYATMSGLMMTRLGYIPTSGDHFEWEQYRFEVVDMDGRRVDKVLVTPINK